MLILLDFIFPNYLGACLYKVSQPGKSGSLARLARLALLMPCFLLNCRCVCMRKEAGLLAEIPVAQAEISPRAPARLFT